MIKRNLNDLLYFVTVARKGSFTRWDFERRGRQLNVRVDGQLIFNTSPNIMDAALAGLASPSCWKKNSRCTSRKAAWCACWKTGAPCFQDIICTIPAADSPLRRSRWWSMRCAMLLVQDDSRTQWRLPL